MRFHYDLSRSKFDAVTQIELGDIARGYRTIDIADTSTNLYSVACNLYFGLVLTSISKKAGVSLVPKKRDGTPLTSRAEALPEGQSGPYLGYPEGNHRARPGGACFRTYIVDGNQGMAGDHGISEDVAKEE
jgi:5'-nucleotidase/UDP-sugar diphosphatase